MHSNVGFGSGDRAGNRTSLAKANSACVLRKFPTSRDPKEAKKEAAFTNLGVDGVHTTTDVQQTDCMNNLLLKALTVAALVTPPPHPPRIA